jgi:hypothetical protein
MSNWFIGPIIGYILGIPLVFVFTLLTEGYLPLPMSKKRKKEEAEVDRAAAAMFLDMLRDENGEINVDLSKANLLGADLSTDRLISKEQT